MPRPRGPVVSRLLALGVVAIAAVAAASAIRGGSNPPVAATDPAEPARGEQLSDAGLGTFPAPGALPGRLVVLTRDACRPRVVDLARLELGPPGPATGCRAWFAPDGRYGAASLPERDGIWLLDIPAGTVGKQLSRSSEPVVFADDGHALAQCGADGRTSIVELASDARRRVDGCRPTFAPDGSVLTRPTVRLPTSVLREGREILGFAKLEAALPASPAGAVSVIGYDEGTGGLLAVLVARLPGRAQEQDVATGIRPLLTLELWRGGELEQALAIPSVTSGFGSRVQLSRSGRHALVTSSGPGVLVLMDLHRPDEPVLQESQLGVAWSPDGAWLAVATADRIEIRAGATFELVYELPLAVRGLAWIDPA